MTTPQKVEEKATLMQVLVGVLAAFFGVRRKASHNKGMRQATPVQVVLVGLLLVSAFVLALVAVVWLVLRLALG